jgi:YggT family protein
MVSLLCQLTLAYEVVLLLRIVLSWFPLQSGGLLAKVNRFFVAATDPVLLPLRRLLPNTGAIDLSPLVALLVLEIVVRQLVLRC